MTEKKRQSTVQPEQTQGFASPAEDELNLIDLLKFIARKKVFILTITSICTIFSILYIQSVTPIYRATVGLLDQNEKFSPFSILEEFYGGPLPNSDPSIVDKVDHQIIKPINVFERLILNIKSQELRQKVFVNGGFQKKYSHGTVIDTKQSVKLFPIPYFRSHPSIEQLLDSRSQKDGVQLEMDGTKPKVMLEFLTVLVEAAKENVNIEIKDKVRSIVKTKINNLSTQIEKLNQNITVQKQIAKEHKAMQKQIAKEIKALEKEIKALEIEELHLQKQIEKKEKAMQIQIEIVHLSEALDMARRMGIKNHNLNKPGSSSFPLWFQYGELALQQKISSLRSKEREIPNTTDLSIEKLKLQRLQQKIEKLQQKISSLRSKEREIPNTTDLSIENIKKLSIKNLELKRWQTADLPLPKFKVVTISDYGYSLANKQNQPWVIVGFGVVFGLFISIFMAFLIDLKQFRSKEISSAST